MHFGVGTGELLAAMPDVGADVMGVDWRIPLDEASRRLGGGRPCRATSTRRLLAAPWPVLEAHVRDVLERGRTAPSHVLNLGHGVPPGTDPERADPHRRVRPRAGIASRRDSTARSASMRKTGAGFAYRRSTGEDGSMSDPSAASHPENEALGYTLWAVFRRDGARPAPRATSQPP